MHISNNYSIKKNRIQIKFYKIVLFYFFIIYSFPPLKQNSITFWFSIILIIISLYRLLLTYKLSITNYTKWTVLFGSIMITSSLWAVNFNYAMDGIKNYFVLTIGFIFMSMLMKEQSDIYEVLRLFVYSKIVMATYIILNLDIANLGSTRLGWRVLGEEWNSNNIGMNMAISGFIIIVLLKETNDKFKRLLYYLILILFSMITLLTGSKKALFILIASIGLYSVITSKNQRFLRGIIVILSGGSLLYLIMNTPFLYDILGSRIDSLISNFSGQGVVDGSTLLRMSMIENGKAFFIEQPAIGYGINNFRELFGNMTGAYEYAHNNYIELLVGVGVIGTAVYYISHIYILKNTFINRNYLFTFAFISILIIFALDIGLVSYYAFYIQFLICVSFSIVDLGKKNSEDFD